MLLNISPDHLERHGGLEGYVHAKELVFKNKKKHLKAVVGVDDPLCLEIFQRLQSKNENTVIPISGQKHLEAGVFSYRGILEYRLDPAHRFSLSFQDNPALKDQHNDQNAAAAYGVLRLLGFSGAQIKASEGFCTFKGVPHRQEWIASVAGVGYVYDSKTTNAEAVACALKAYGLGSVPPHTIYWIAGGRPKEASLEGLQSFWTHIEGAFSIGEATEVFGQILAAHCVPYQINHTLEEACLQATQQARRHQKLNPLVLLSPVCTSFD